jgi:hypothetical protein
VQLAVLVVELAEGLVPGVERIGGVEGESHI